MTQLTDFILMSIDPLATEAQIKKEYRRLLHIFHPDQNPELGEWGVAQFRELVNVRKKQKHTSRKCLVLAPASYEAKRQSVGTTTEVCLPHSVHKNLTLEQVAQGYKLYIPIHEGLPTKENPLFGYNPHLKSYKLFIPPGVQDGVFFSGLVPYTADRIGELTVNIEVEPHIQYERVGDNLRLRTPVKRHWWRKTIDIPLLDGTELPLRKDHPTVNGAYFVINGKGLPNQAAWERGTVKRGDLQFMVN